MSDALLEKLLAKTNEIGKITIEAEQNITRTRKQAELRTISNYYPGGAGVTFTDEQIEANKAAAEIKVKEIKAEREAAIDTVVAEGETIIANAESEAAQAVADATPLPTDKDLARIEQLRKEYEKMTFDDKAAIMKRLQYETSHGTSAAPALYFFAQEVMQKDAETVKALANCYRAIFKDSIKAHEVLEDVGRSADAFRAEVLIRKYNRLDSELSFMERVAIKNKIAEYGYINLLAQ